MCAQVDADLFFPEKGQNANAAVAVCKMCPVRARVFGGTGECLDYALRRDERYGVWGGVSERARRRMKRGEPPAPARTHCGRGHELAVVGVSSQGACMECRRRWDRDYQVKLEERYRREREARGVA